MTYNETNLTVSIADIIISEGFSFSLAQKPMFKKIIYLEITMLKSYQPPNIKLISKDILGVIHDQNMEKNLSLIKKESDVFWIIISR